MNPNDPTVVAAGAILCLALAFALWPRKRPLIAERTRPGRALIDAFEESGKDSAGNIVEIKLGEQKAREIIASLTNAFNPPAGAASPPAAPPAPPAAS